MSFHHASAYIDIFYHTLAARGLHSPAWRVLSIATTFLLVLVSNGKQKRRLGITLTFHSV